MISTSPHEISQPKQYFHVSAGPLRNFPVGWGWVKKRGRFSDLPHGSIQPSIWRVGDLDRCH